MNYQQRNRALFEGIREPYEKTGGNRNVSQIREVGINYNLVINV
jgi:hypothetical protein